MMDEKAISKDSPLPLYYQLKELIRSQIELNHLKPGDSIPSERELAERYGISRPTIRQAIQELVVEGLLIREKGRRTTVATPKFRQWFLESLTSFQDEMAQKRLSFSTKVLAFERVPASSTLREVLGANVNICYKLQRLRYVEGKPVVLVTTFLPLDLFPEMDRENLEQNSMYHLIQSKYGYRIGGATRVIEAINASAEDAKLLGIAPGDAVQLIRTTGYLDNNRPFEYSIAYYRGDLSSFTVNLKYSQ